MEDSYITLTDNKIGQGTYSERRSKFLAFAHHIETEEAAKHIIQSYRKKYFDARHVCYAYSLGYNSPITRMNDDGEPSSTGGKPIFGQIVKNSLTDAIVVVVRYYGGVNLGTGPLAVAYKTAAAAAIDDAEKQVRFVEECLDFSFPYEKLSSVMRIIKNQEARIIEQNFDNTCRIKLSIRSSKASMLRESIDKAISF